MRPGTKFGQFLRVLLPTLFSPGSDKLVETLLLGCYSEPFLTLKNLFIFYLAVKAAKSENKKAF